jgi:5'(3')-deoxyribonucleotidase
MIIAFDWDSVMTNTMQIVMKLFHEKYPDKPVPRITDLSWDFWNEMGITKEQGYEFFQLMRDNKDYKYSSPCDTNFYVWLKMLMNQHDCYILTSNPPEIIALIEHWLNQYGIKGLPIVRVNGISNKKNEQWDVLIDDAPEAIQMFRDDLSAVAGRELLVYNQPYNDSAALPLGCTRVYNWQNVYEHITRLNKIQQKELI